VTGDTLLIEGEPETARAAVLREGVLRRLILPEPPGTARRGDIVAGRVSRVAAAIDAAFVDVGDPRHGLLGGADAGTAGANPVPIGEAVAEGDTVIVQVTREAVAHKGPRLSARLTLPGRFLVCLPQEPGEVRLSGGIAGAERNRLRDVLTDLAESIGTICEWIVRRAAVGVDMSTIADEARPLAAAADADARAAGTATPPATLRRAPPAALQAVMDAARGDGVRVVADHPAMLAAVRRVAPDLAERAERWSGPGRLFECQGVEDEIAAALLPEVPLPGGGRLLIHETPALVAIDVDSAAATAGGRESTALTVNRQAASAVADAIMLRDLGGAIVIDFVPMRRRAYREQVLAVLVEGLAADDRPRRIGGFTKLGLVELTRQRLGPSLGRRLTEPCLACDGTGRAPIPAAMGEEGKVVSGDG